MIRRLIGRALTMLPRRSIVPILSGGLRGSRWLIEAGTHGCWVGTYEQHSQLVFSQTLRAGDCVFDLGANVGFFTLLASKLVGNSGHVFAFEPLPRNIDYLKSHVRLNEAKNITIMPVAVSDRRGTARFQSDGHPSMGGLRDGGSIEVETVSLDGLLRAGALPPPDFMKIDVEGGEFDVLKGAVETIAKGAPTVLLSNHGWEQHHSCCALLQEWGYNIESLRDGTADGDYVVVARKSRPA